MDGTGETVVDAAVGSPFDDGELYDAIFHDFDYAVDFYVALARQARGPILDVGCGTGRVLLPCLQAGAIGHGLDNAAAMLDRLRAKAANLGFDPPLHQADMSHFSLPQRFSLVAITFNAFAHNLTQADQIRCLRCCREHLLPGGRLALDAYFPGLGIIGAAENTRVLELETRDPRTGLPLRLYDTRRFDRVEQIQHSVNEIEKLNEAGEVLGIERSEFDVRWVYKHEMALLLRCAGFSHWMIHGDFSGRDLTMETDAMVVQAWNEP